MEQSTPLTYRAVATWRTAFRRHFEWAALAGGLLLMAGMDPYAAQHGFCLLEWAGIGFCPGEGLGRSIAWAAHGEFARSLEYHLMGIPAILILGGRSARLFCKNVLKI